jgi:hypothetical protein
MVKIYPSTIAELKDGSFRLSQSKDRFSVGGWANGDTVIYGDWYQVKLLL